MKHLYKSIGQFSMCVCAQEVEWRLEQLLKAIDDNNYGEDDYDDDYEY